VRILTTCSEFLRHLMRHLPGKLLIIWDGLRSHRSHLVWDFVRQQRGDGYGQRKSGLQKKEKRVCQRARLSHFDRQ
jgi:hypothetical protein